VIDSSGLRKWNVANKLIKTEKTTYLPKCEFIGVDFGKPSSPLQDRVLQVVHRSTILDRDRKRPIRHIENPTEESDGASWIV
jgi:hypothetical protein